MKAACSETLLLAGLLLCFFLSPVLCNTNTIYKAHFSPETATESEHTVVAVEGMPDTCPPSAIPIGISTGNCSWYHENSWWLPNIYVDNAFCVCTQSVDTNEKSFSCVRRFVREHTDTYYSEAQKKALADRKSDNPIEYDAYLAEHFTKTIYKAHVDAYSKCCCPSGPAPYLSWIGVSMVPLPCPLVREAVLFAGSCHGTPGSW